MAISFQNVWNQHSSYYGGPTVNIPHKVLLSKADKKYLMEMADEEGKKFLEAHTELYADYEVTAHDYGVVGDGNTDDTAAIQAAINAGVPIPPGNYLITFEKEDGPALWDQI